jgi:hypothetical protein
MAMKDLEKQIIEELGTQMQSEIDKEVLWGMLVKMGWTRVLLPRFDNRDHAVYVFEWVEQHCKNPYERKGNEFIFESEVDAVNFTLRWK